jgi:hypothetical protein
VGSRVYATLPSHFIEIFVLIKVIDLILTGLQPGVNRSIVFATVSTVWSAQVCWRIKETVETVSG